MNEKRQAYNPFLPLDEYIPDGEPHIFDGRVYLYGSHDKEGGYTFCMEDYVTYSAPVHDLTDWRYEGVIYKASNDPEYPAKKYMYAPDVVQGNDGRYYLYYCMSGDYGVGGYTGTIQVAVCDSPCGEFQFLGTVQNPDGTPMKKYVCFDPAVINDNGVIRLYYGTQYDFEERENFEENPDYILQEMEMFGRTKEELLAYRQDAESCVNGKRGDCDSIMGAACLVLCDDMLTVKEAPKHIIPYRVKGTGFEAHPFFEGSSMRKVGDKYYFVYSSFQNHELCYAVSDYPDRDFTFGGTIVSNGDIGYEGRCVKHNMTGTTHGSMIEINHQWYVFYHRLTHKSDYSRQACAEKICIESDGSIKQVELTSCGLNDGPLIAKAGYEYPSVIACIVTNGHMPHGCNSIYKDAFPNVSHKGEDRFIAEIENDTLIGYKYFAYKGVTSVKLTARVESDRNRVLYEGPVRVDERSGSGNTEKKPDAEHGSAEDAIRDKLFFEVRLTEDGPVVGEIALSDCEEWTVFEGNISVPDGVHGLFLTYKGNKRVQLLTVAFGGLTIKYNSFSAEEFISLWESVWDGAPAFEQTELAMKHTLFRAAVYDGEEIVAMARMIGDMGLCYYIKDVVVRPEYQGKGIGKMLMDELIKYINNHGVKDTDIFVELCAMPDKIPFYERFGFAANEAQRLRIISTVH